MSNTFQARYRGRCDFGDEIHPGDEVLYDEDRIVHRECLMERVRDQIRTRFPAPAVVCQGCFIEKPCECDDRAREILDQLGLTPAQDKLHSQSATSSDNAITQGNHLTR
jgi:hypothetical protein